MDAIEPVPFASTRATLDNEGIQVRISHERGYHVDPALVGSSIYMTVGAFNALDGKEEELAKPSDILKLNPKGGSTVCVLVDKESGEELARAATRVHPEDHFCKKTGRELALAMALTVLREQEAISA